MSNIITCPKCNATRQNCSTCDGYGEVYRLGGINCNTCSGTGQIDVRLGKGNDVYNITKTGKKIHSHSTTNWGKQTCPDCRGKGKDEIYYKPYKSGVKQVEKRGNWVDTVIVICKIGYLALLIYSIIWWGWLGLIMWFAPYLFFADLNEMSETVGVGQKISDIQHPYLGLLSFFAWLFFVVHLDREWAGDWDIGYHENVNNFIVFCFAFGTVITWGVNEGSK